MPWLSVLTGNIFIHYTVIVKHLRDNFTQHFPIFNQFGTYNVYLWSFYCENMKSPDPPCAQNSQTTTVVGVDAATRAWSLTDVPSTTLVICIQRLAQPLPEALSLRTESKCLKWRMGGLYFCNTRATLFYYFYSKAANRQPIIFLNFRYVHYCEDRPNSLHKKLTS